MEGNGKTCYSVVSSNDQTTDIRSIKDLLVAVYVLKAYEELNETHTFERANFLTRSKMCRSARPLPPSYLQLLLRSHEEASALLW